VGELLVSQRRGEELQLLATTDELTGLLSRKHFEDLLDQEVEAAKQSGQRFGVMLLDLDRFKDINDTLGHQYGDLALVQLAPRIAAMVGERGLVARFGGDEFAVLPAQRTGDMELLDNFAAELLACVEEPITVEAITLEMSASIGVARFPTDGQDGQTLLRRADIAMYVAKDRHDGHRLYDPQYDHHSTSRLSLLGDFRRALAEDQLVVHYHPIIDLKTREVQGAEGLVRWQHPTHGLLQPGAFLQLVEQTGLIGLLTSRVVEIAIRDCARWHREGHRFTVSVNLSARNLVNPKLPAEIDALLKRYSLPSSALKLEITESMIVTDPERALATLDGLHGLGVRLALDDFGTGYSSLANLRKLPVDELKIDRSFVTPMLEDMSDLAIVRSTIDLGHSLGLRVTGEGVETAPLLNRLDELGCDLAQGHHLNVPVPADEFIAWATERRTSMAQVR
jgi:diguanylate cyclase (GGDEF)-like protein